MAVTTRDITGKVLDPSRTTALDGEYRFTPTQEIRTSAGDIIPARPIVAPFYSNPPAGSNLAPGQFKVTLIANDSADLEQAAATYRVELYLASRPDRLQGEPINIVVPKTGTGDLQLAKLVPVTVPGEVALYLTEAIADQRYLKLEDVEEVDLTGVVRKVNGVGPDSSGNVVVNPGTSIGSWADVPKPTGGIPVADLAAEVATADEVTQAITTATGGNKTVKTINNGQPDANGNFNIAVGLSVPNPVTLITGRAAPKAVLCCQDNAAVYDATSNKTFLSYLGVSRALYVKEFDHATLTWSDDTYVADYPTAVGIEDDHGTPSLTILPNGKLFIVFGSHQTAPIFATSTVARSVTGGWTTATGPAVTVGTYHAVATSGSKVFLLFRAGTGHTGSSSAAATYPSHEFAGLAVSADNGATWTQAGPIADLNVYSPASTDSGKDFYHSGFKAVGDYLYFTWTVAHGVLHDGERSQMYVAKYQVSTGKLFTQGGTDLGTIIDTKAKLDACVAINGDYAQGCRFLVESDGTFVGAASFQATDGTLATYFVRRGPSDSSWFVKDTGLRRHYGFADHHIARKAGGGYVIYAVTGREGEPTILKNILEKVSYVGVGGDLTVAFTTDNGVTWAATQVMSRWQTAGQGIQGPTCPENAHPTLSAIVVPGSVSGGLSGGLPTDRLPLFGVSQTVANAAQVLAAAQAGTKSVQYLNRVQFLNNPTKPASGTWTTVDLNNYVPFNVTRVLVNVSAFFNGVAGRVTMAFRRNGTQRDGDASLAFNAGGPAAGGDVWVPVGPDKKIQYQLGYGAQSTDPQFGAIYANIAAIETEGGGASTAGRPYVLAAPVAPLYTPPAQADTTAPTAPTSVAASPGAGSATLTPTGATDNVGVTGYRAYSAQTGGSPLATGASTVTVGGLTGGQAYTFWVSAVDAAGNESARTQSASVTPTAATTPATAFVLPSGMAAQPSFLVVGDQIVTSGGKVTGWKDYTGGLDSSVPSGKAVPDYVAAAFGTNRPGASFTKSATMGLLWAKAMSGNGQTVFILFKVPSVNVGRMLWAGATSDAEPSGAPIVYNNTTAQVTARLGGGAAATTTNSPSSELLTTAASVHRASFSASTNRVVKSVLNGNNVSSATTASSTATASTGLGIGAVGTDTSDIVIGLLAVFDAELSEADAHSMTQAIATYGGVTIGSN